MKITYLIKKKLNYNPYICADISNPILNLLFIYFIHGSWLVFLTIRACKLFCKKLKQF